MMQTPPDDILISQIGPEHIDKLEHLWKALHYHHAKVTPQLGATRSPHESWLRRRTDYAIWLNEPETFVLLAEFNKQSIGYAFVRVKDSDSTTWESDGRVAKVETLSILPEFRSQGIGTKLMHAIYAHLSNQGIDEVSLTVVATNPKAIEFYEREGFSQWFLTMGRRIAE